jgi:hypothetical protein
MYASAFEKPTKKHGPESVDCAGQTIDFVLSINITPMEPTQIDAKILPGGGVRYRKI